HQRPPRQARHPRRRRAPPAIHDRPRGQREDGPRDRRPDALLREVRRGREYVGRRQGLPQRGGRGHSRAGHREVHRRARRRRRLHPRGCLLADGVAAAQPRDRPAGAPIGNLFTATSMTESDRPGKAPTRSSDAAGQRGDALALADRDGRDFLRNADPTLARLINSLPNFRPRGWTTELPRLDAFGTLIFQVIGQQLSVSATRTILSRVEQRFCGRLPTPAELLAADPQVLRASGMSNRKGATLRAVAERFVDGRLSDEAFARMTDAEVESALTEVPGIGPWTARGFLIVA